MHDTTPAKRLDILTNNIQAKLLENHYLTKGYNRNINQNSIQIGQWLIESKEIVGHGNWQIWLEKNFNLSIDSAQDYIKVAAYFGVNSTFKFGDVSDFQFSKLVALTKLKPAELQNFLFSNPDTNFQKS